MNPLHTIAACLCICCLSLCSFAQSVDKGTNRFDAEGISFDYLSGWSVKDESTSEVQKLNLKHSSSSDRVTIVVKRAFVRRSESSVAIENFAEELAKDLTAKVGPRTGTPQRTNIKTQIGSTEVEGIRVQVSSGARTGEAICFRMRFRLIGLVLVRSSSKESVGAKLLESIRASLGVAAPVVGVKTADRELSEDNKIDEGVVLNGKALALPQPSYPALARAANVSGTVVVQVLIDEQGDVVAASFVSGHPLLKSVCVAAARQAKFSPTLLDGEPIRVTGVIHYNFMHR